ncbi:hypothetical protein OG936_19045 [Streptomyces sp. NBC_00846]|uniref:hypothetical protein n=1 Tax=Streptomyces sp. NBC_00846 TaxID=2975849 RepID=UPI00386DC4EB|nr:hypothetical protein OG936_19045 [Streptomyces sp. NBC_00846]
MEFGDGLRDKEKAVAELGAMGELVVAVSEAGPEPTSGVRTDVDHCRAVSPYGTKPLVRVITQSGAIPHGRAASLDC